MSRNQVLVPIDEKEFTLQIIPYLFRYLRPEENELTFLYVAAESTDAAMQQLPLIPQLNGDEHKAMDDFFSQELHPYTSALQQAGFTVFTTVDFEDSLQAIERQLRQKKIDLITMATVEDPRQRGADSVARQLLGQSGVLVMHFHDDGTAASRTAG